MEVIQTPIGKLIPYIRNPRKNDQAISKVAGSITEFGFKQPIVVDSEMVIIAGHTRLLAAQQLELAEVPVVIANDLTEAQVKAYRIADNRTAQEAEWDNDLLKLELLDLIEFDFDLLETGFDPNELAELLTTGNEGLTDDDYIPEDVEPTAKLGDVWQLEAHRLVCGDSTGIDAVNTLMNGQRADMVFTDPPYNVDYEGYTDKKLTIKSDAMGADEYCLFMKNVFVNYRQAIKDGAGLYICHASAWQREIQNVMEEAGFEMRNQIIWAKNTFAWGMGRYKFQHEPIFFSHVRGKSDAWYGDKTQSTLWEEKKPAANRLHPTMKPVELIERAVNNSSKSGDIIIDLFGGSGSTLIACEKTNRNCYMMELDPKYCDVIVKRWEDYTGQEAKLTRAIN